LISSGVRDGTVLTRKYTLHFKDHADVLWRQHFPSLLDAEAAMADVLKRQVPEGVVLDLSWGRLKTARPMICLGLGECQVSFYDFMLWYVDAFNGVFAYDYDEKKYCFSSKKNGGDKPGKLRREGVEQFQFHLPAADRSNPRILNASTEASSKVTIKQDFGVDGIHRDVLVRTPIASEVDERKTLEGSRVKHGRTELEVVFNQFPDFPFWPGVAVGLQDEFFSPDLYGVKTTWRPYRVFFSGAAKSGERDDKQDIAEAPFELEMKASWEHEDDPVAKLPTFSIPRYPIIVEGKILCEIGGDGDRTYMVYTDEATSQNYYKVMVPLWNKEIMVPFGPHFMPGHLYFPAFKESRVLLALYFDRAELLRYLDWGADVQLPTDSQGNHILFGKNKTSETSAKHVYVDSKPVFSIQRIDNGDIELLHMEDGTIVIETKEDESLKEGEAKFDLSAQVAAARAKLTMDAKSNIAQLTGGFEKGSTALNAEIDGAVGQTKAALEGVEEEIGGKVDEVTGEMEAALQQLSQKTGALAGAASSAKAELKKKLGF
jgi:hypothetical protein